MTDDHRIDMLVFFMLVIGILAIPTVALVVRGLEAETQRTAACTCTCPE